MQGLDLGSDPYRFILFICGREMNDPLGSLCLLVYRVFIDSVSVIFDYRIGTFQNMLLTAVVFI